MADILKLKKKAADLEAKKQADKALDVYRAIIEAYEAGEEDIVDIPMYNRVGDLLQRAGSLAEAVSVWEKAVDHYSEGGFYNPAIALCNKILRASPGRTVIYYKLGKIHAEKGFKGDARSNFLEYANRQQKGGNLDEAFRALKEFADLVPDQHDVRIMLADQLVKAERKDEAIAQLQLGYAHASSEDDEESAELIVAKMKEIDPSVEPKAEGKSSSGGSGGLVFLDVDLGDHEPPKPAAKKAKAAALKRATKSLEGLDIIAPPIEELPSAPKPKPAARKSEPAEPSTEPTVEPPTVPTPEPPAPEVRNTKPTSQPWARTSTSTEEPAARTSQPAEQPPVRKTVPTQEPADDLLIEPTDVGSDAPPPRGSIAGLETTSVEEPAVEEAEIPILEIEPTVESPIPDVEEVEPLPELEPTVEDDSSLGIDSSVGSFSDATEADPALMQNDSAALGGTESADLPLLDFDDDDIAEPAATDEGSDEAFPILEMEPALGGDTDSEPLVEQEPMLGGDITFLEPEPLVEAEPIPELSGTDDIELVDPDESVDEVEEVEEVVEAAAEAAPVMVEVSLEELRVRVDVAPDDWGVRRQFAEALLESGDRAAAITELEASMVGYEQNGDLDTAGSIAEEIVRLEPKSIRHHQKRVEFAFRANDRTRLAEAYVELADALLADGQALKARAVYQRVLDITPDDLRAQAAIESIPDEPPPPPPASRRSSHAPTVRPSPTKPTKAQGDDEEYVSLGDWLREDDEPKSLRMVVEEQEPTGDEAADFADMLRKFKQGVSDNVDAEDHEAHYDLGVAYKEMGLLDEAIAEFQKALRGTSGRVRTFEALGHCFVEKQQLKVGATILQRALSEPAVRDEELVGVLYLLGAISEELQQFADAKRYYERVFAVDIQFRDIGDRLNVVEQHLT